MSEADSLRPILLIDNYDSFTQNLFHLLIRIHRRLTSQSFPNRDVVRVLKNDVSPASLETDWPRRYSCVIISPGPGNPNEARDVGLTRLILSRQDEIPIFGVCLGMQAMALSWGAAVRETIDGPMHGRTSSVRNLDFGGELESTLMKSLPQIFEVVRYHSLSVYPPLNDERWSENVRVTSRVCPNATAPHETVMSIEHKTKPLFGVQFHPESIRAGEAGEIIVENFLRLALSISANPLASERFLSRSAPEVPALFASEVHRSCVEVSLESPASCLESVFSALFSSEACVFFDSAASTTGNFSIMADSSGPHAERVEFFVDPSTRRMETTTFDPSHRETRMRARWTLGSGSPTWSDEKDSQDVFECLKRATHAKGRVRIVDDASSGPTPPRGDFACGYVGVLGYGLRKSCCFPEHVRAWKQEKVDPTVLPDASFLYVRRSVVFDHERSRFCVMTLVNPTDEADRRVQLAWKSKALRYLGSLKESRHSSASGPRLDKIQMRAAMDSEAYESSVRECLREITRGESYEICLTNRFEGGAPASLDPWRLYTTLRSTNPAPYGCYFRPNSNHVLASSSPELFVSVDETGLCTSKPIKGTRKRDLRDPAADARIRAELASSEKDVSENLMIVDLVRNDLGVHAEPDGVFVSDLFKVESFATVHQLVSTIHARLEPDKVFDALRACFPPGSMTGAPKLRTMEIIDRLESPRERGWYSGAVGYVSTSGAAKFSVVIRALTLTRKAVESWSVSLGAGGAVVALSSPREEREEMRVKVDALGVVAVVESKGARSQM